MWDPERSQYSEQIQNMPQTVNGCDGTNEQTDSEVFEDCQRLKRRVIGIIGNMARKLEYIERL